MDSGIISEGAPTSLCETCRTIDLGRLIRRVVVFGRPEIESIHYDIGTIEEVKERRDRCELCRIITKYLERSKDGEEKFSTKDVCRVHSGMFARGIRINQDLSEPHEPYLTLSHVTVEVVPASISNFEEAVRGPALPPGFYLPGFEIGTLKEDIKPIHLLSLHAGRKTITSVDDFCRTANGSADNDAISYPARTREDIFDMRLAGRWLEFCRKRHGSGCGVPLRQYNIAKSLIPTNFRVIDVENLCIIGAPDGCSYAALSYCWGSNSNTFRCTNSSVRELEFPGAIDSAKLPKTIWDAIRVTLKLGLTYLWVDALCIIQDNDEHMQDHIPLMCYIYERATLTIIASNGVDSSAGLAGLDAGSRSVEHDHVRLSNMSLLPLVDDGEYHGLMNSRWQTRGWTLQEKYFSRRRLIFTPAQVYWHCKCAVWFEEIELEFAGDEFSFNRTTGITGIGDEALDLPTDAANLSIALYANMLREFTSRNISFPSDSLKAFDGVIEVFSSGTGQQFHWGLPEKAFSLSISWTSDGEVERNVAKTRILLPNKTLVEISNPTWSWSAWTHRGGFFFGARLTGHSLQKLRTWIVPTTILFYRCGVDGSVKAVDQDIETQAAPWVGTPREVEIPVQNTGDPFIDSGLLKCWTSTAPVFVCRERSIVSIRKYSYFLVLENYSLQLFSSTDMQSTNHIPRHDEKRHLKLPQFIQGFVSETRDVFEVKGIALGNFNSKENLYVLLVELENEIAYRIGAAEISAERWMDTKRKWELVTLG